jgi:hypothetical protein
MEKLKQFNKLSSQQQQLQKPEMATKQKAKTVDIDFLHKVVFDINSKLDSNIYWLTTLLQNIILSIETLNKKTINLDKRLTVIENSKNINNNNNSNDFEINIPTLINENFDLNEKIIENDLKEKVVLRRRTTIQVMKFLY